MIDIYDKSLSIRDLLKEKGFIYDKKGKYPLDDIDHFESVRESIFILFKDSTLSIYQNEYYESMRILKRQIKQFVKK
jgi:hypothetical protein